MAEERTLTQEELTKIHEIALEENAIYVHEIALEENTIYDLRGIIGNGLIYKSLAATLMERTGKNEYETKEFIQRLVSEECLEEGGLAYPIKKPTTEEDLPAYEKTKEDLTLYKLGSRWREKVQSIVG